MQRYNYDDAIKLLKTYQSVDVSDEVQRLLMMIIDLTHEIRMHCNHIADLDDEINEASQEIKKHLRNNDLKTEQNND